MYRGGLIAKSDLLETTFCWTTISEQLLYRILVLKIITIKSKIKLIEIRHQFFDHLLLVQWGGKGTFG